MERRITRRCASWKKMQQHWHRRKLHAPLQNRHFAGQRRRQRTCRESRRNTHCSPIPCPCTSRSHSGRNFVRVSSWRRSARNKGFAESAGTGTAAEKIQALSAELEQLGITSGTMQEQHTMEQLHQRQEILAQLETLLRQFEKGSGAAASVSDMR